MRTEREKREKLAWCLSMKESMADDRHFQFYIGGAIDMLAWFLGWDDPTEASEEKLVALARGERETVQ